jgi:hypothetical protein
VHVLCHAYGRKQLGFDRKAVLLSIEISLILGRWKMREFCGVAKSDSRWKGGDPLCFSWDIELFVSLYSDNKRIRTVCRCGALCSSSVDGFLWLSLETS